jgi:hypothetical protein
MTNITKKHNNALQQRSPSPATGTGNLTVQELLEKNAELERRLKKYKRRAFLSFRALLTSCYRKKGAYPDYDQTTYSP